MLINAPGDSPQYGPSCFPAIGFHASAGLQAAEIASFHSTRKLGVEAAMTLRRESILFGRPEALATWVARRRSLRLTDSISHPSTAAA